MRARTRDARRRTTTRAAAAIAAALVAIAAPVTVATTASAHSALVSSDPASGAELAAPPEQVTLTFNEEILELGAAVFVVDAAGVDHAGEPVVEGSTVTIPLASTLPGGASEVRWRVVSADGHPISDVIPFTVAGEAPAPSEPAATDAAADDAAASAEPEAPAAEVDASAEPDAAAADEAGVSRTLLVGVAGAAAALVVLALVLGMRRRRAAAGARDAFSD